MSQDEGTIRLERQNPETDSDGVIGFLETDMFLGEFSLCVGSDCECFSHDGSLLPDCGLSSTIRAARVKGICLL